MNEAWRGTDMDCIARRRQRLIVDYQLYTRDKAEAYNGPKRGLRRFVRRCLPTVRRQFLTHYFASPPRWRIWVRNLAKERALPDFCIIGPPKAGTSDLAVSIMAHPNVLHPMVKEFNSTDPLDWKSFYPTLRMVQNQARKLGVAQCACVLPYLHHLDIPVTLSALRPDTKIVITLRDPVDLIFSMWKWNILHRGKHLVDRVPFLATFPAYVDHAMELFHEAPGPFAGMLQAGIYATSVAHWLRAFGEQNVCIFDIAEYFEDRGGLFFRVEEFLGLPHVALPPRLPVVNRNPVEAPAPLPDTSAKLKGFFEPYNRRLWKVIGTEYPW